MAKWIVSGSHTRYFTDVEIKADTEQQAREKAEEYFQDEFEDYAESEVTDIIRCTDDE